jgi:hypothetical protein
VVPPCSDRISRVPPYSRTICLSTCTGLSPCIARLSIRFQFLTYGHWPGPRSLATTNGVSVDVLSSGYLDVSVRRVCFVTLCIQITIPHMRWVAPFGNLRIKGYSHLPVTYRSVSRPSSPLSAKASIKCSFALVLKISDVRHQECFSLASNGFFVRIIFEDKPDFIHEKEVSIIDVPYSQPQQIP